MKINYDKNHMKKIVLFLSLFLIAPIGFILWGIFVKNQSRAPQPPQSPEMFIGELTVATSTPINTPTPTCIPNYGVCFAGQTCCQGICVGDAPGSIPGHCIVGVSSTIVPTGPTQTPISTYTPTPTVTPKPTSTPTPPLDNPYAIPIGSKQSLTINIGEVDPNAVHVRFGIKLETAHFKPEIKVRLKVVDLSAAPTPAPADTCQTPGAGQYFYRDIPMVADNYGQYYPRKGATFKDSKGTVRIDDEGWVPLRDLAPNKAYALFVKGPKHRDIKMVENVTLKSAKPESQYFNWTAKLLPAGDLPDPNNDLKQDCIVNSVDLTLAEDRIGKTDKPSLDIADVNYDNVVNANDVSKIVKTLTENDEDDY